MTPQVKPRQLIELLAAAIPAKRNVLITGMPGIGKTALVLLAAKLCGANVILCHPAIEDPTDIKGFPCIVGGEARFVPFGQLKAMIDASTLTVVFLDDVGQATPAMQSAYMQVVWGGKVAGHAISEHVTFIAATNDRKHKANVQGLIEPFKSRFACIVELVADLAESRDWMIANGYQPELLAFLSFRPDLFAAFAASADMVNSPTPRTWEHFSHLLSLNLSPATRTAALAGAVGASAATEYLTFERMFAELTSIPGILRDGKSGTIPTAHPDRMWAICAALAHQVTRATMPQVAVYAKRLFDAGCGEYAALLVGDIERRHPDLKDSAAYVGLITGEYGKLLTGRAA